MKRTSKKRIATAEDIARLADKGEDVSRFYTKTGRMMPPIHDVVSFRVPAYKSGKGFNIPKKKCDELRISDGDSVHLVIHHGKR